MLLELPGDKGELGAVLSCMREVDESEVARAVQEGHVLVLVGRSGRGRRRSPPGLLRRVRHLNLILLYRCSVARSLLTASGRNLVATKSSGCATAGSRGHATTTSSGLVDAGRSGPVAIGAIIRIIIGQMVRAAGRRGQVDLGCWPANTVSRGLHVFVIVDVDGIGRSSRG